MIFYVIFARKTDELPYRYTDLFVYEQNAPTRHLEGNRDVLNGESNLHIANIITSKAIKYHIDPDLLLRIAICESNLKPEAQNTHSTASGIFQFLTSTFINEAQAYGLPGDNKNDPEIQAELAARMISDGKIGAWNQSKSCWNI